MKKEIKKIEQAILDKILYIGNEIPKSVANDNRSKFVVLGNPQELIDETINKSFREFVIWIAEYAYRKSNPKSKMDTPSIVYEQVEKDFKKWIVKEHKKYNKE